MSEQGKLGGGGVYKLKELNKFKRILPYYLARFEQTEWWVREGSWTLQRSHETRLSVGSSCERLQLQMTKPLLAPPPMLLQPNGVCTYHYESQQKKSNSQPFSKIYIFKLLLNKLNLWLRVRAILALNLQKENNVGSLLRKKSSLKKRKR